MTWSMPPYDGFRVEGSPTIFLYKAGWVDNDSLVINLIAATLGDPRASEWAQKNAPIHLMAWADEGCREHRGR